MDIKKAIKTMEYNKHLLGLPDQGSTWTPNANTIACDIAITALQEQLEREKGCEYCNTENRFTETGRDIISKPYLKVYIAKQPLSETYYLITSEYEELKNIKGQYNNSPFRSDKTEIYNCPICGRKLKEVREE